MVFPWIRRTASASTRCRLASAARNSLLALADCAINTVEDASGDVISLRQWRKALRDVPQQTGFPGNRVFPASQEGAAVPESQLLTIHAFLTTI